MCIPSPGYCSSPGPVCVLSPLWRGWASSFCCPLAALTSSLRMENKDKQSQSLCLWSEAGIFIPYCHSQFSMSDTCLTLKKLLQYPSITLPSFHSNSLTFISLFTLKDNWLTDQPETDLTAVVRCQCLGMSEIGGRVRDGFYYKDFLQLSQMSEWEWDYQS